MKIKQHILIVVKILSKIVIRESVNLVRFVGNGKLFMAKIRVHFERKLKDSKNEAVDGIATSVMCMIGCQKSV